ncbi:MAG: pentapeptide repeat-containing protein, partial [Coleofasciculaceae cyanobacterium]
MDVSELLARYEAGERDFCEINLSGADLSYADLCGADLSDAELCFANLTCANLSAADLSNADLSATNLIGADLVNANLSSANLSLANLSLANFSNTNLTNANLSYANLIEANFTNATLTGAILNGTILAYQNIVEQLRQENQILTEKVKLLEEQLEKQKQTQDLNTASNQGINGRYKWNNFNFRSKTEMKIAEALDCTGVLFYPNSKARLNKAE